MREIVNLNYKWAYTKMVEEVPETMPVKWDFVNLPHSWNNIDGQDGGNDYYRGTCLYVKELDKADLPIADQYYLEFRGANSSAEVYVNGSRLAQHDGGYSTWRVNVSEALQDGKNLIAVAVDNSENDRVYPQMADFTFYGGLYRDVNLIAVNNSHFDLDYYGSQGLRVTPQIKLADNEDDTKNKNASAAVEIEVFLNDIKPGQELVYSVIDGGGVVVAEYKTPADETAVTLKVQSAHLWHGRQDPYLYTAEVMLVSGEEIIDNVSTRFGLRTFAIDPDQGFILNGRSYPLRGVSRHQDRWGFGNALLPEHHEEDMDLICEMGATTIRLAHYQHDQYFYDLCDERGMVVWAEIPYISKHMPNARDNTISQMRELVAQNYNHPSIVVWGLSNEISMSSTNNDDMIENHKTLNDLVHEMDTTRLTTIACVSMCDINDPYVQIPDVVSYNHYFGWYGGDT
ncbi:MAG: glycoside hydrolase family 2 TIM barrel-domain containing protein, partial [Eubacteriales bacterium]|nr:glycoside hydrolase family 2 TIM barrel-domain containing protein [Eubacteriales bacterium]MDD3198326.1 glycoside hydrolase family 2 TIM barrel-domain containing protein [Eubacteriales bacterium]